MTTIPFFDLKEQNESISKDLDRVWRETVSGREFILGRALKTFEDNFARFTGSRFAVGVSSGLDALTLSLKALKVGPGDEVILPANTFIATALAVSQTGARPVLADVEPVHLLLEAKGIKKALTKRTKAVIPVHLYGMPCDMGPIAELCKKESLYLIEDACQAHGAAMNGRACGSFGQMGCFSFYPGKNLGAFGDGGLITTDDESLRERLLLLRNYGSMVKYRHTLQGHNMRLDTLQAAILDAKLPYLREWNRRRGLIAERYRQRLSGMRGLTIPQEKLGAAPVWHLYVVRTPRRDALRAFLEKNGVGTGIHYPVPIHLQEAYADLRKKKGSYPVSEKACDECVSLPMYPEMPLKYADKVSSLIGDFLGTDAN